MGTNDLRTIITLPPAIAACFGREVTVIPGRVPSGVPHRRVPRYGTRPETPFAEGLARTVAWYREHDPEVPDG